MESPGCLFVPALPVLCLLARPILASPALVPRPRQDSSGRTRERRKGSFLFCVEARGLCEAHGTVDRHTSGETEAGPAWGWLPVVTKYLMATSIFLLFITYKT